MPRKYRPPAARRRKTKRPAPYYVEPLPQGGEAPVSEDGAGPPAVEDPAPEPVAAPERNLTESRPVDRPTATAAKHIAKDYSYVRAEVRRILLVGGFLIVSLMITALLRN